MNPEAQAMLMQFAQQMGLMPGASGFNGHNDALLYSMGMPTSANMPSMYNINNLGFLQSMREDYIKNDGDYFLNRAAKTTGFGQRQTAAFINMFPQLQSLVSTRADMLGGSYGFAQSINPLMATTDAKGGSQRDAFKEFESEIYKYVRNSEGYINENFRGIASEKDAGAILSFATQTGQMRGRRLQANGSLEDVDSDTMVEEAKGVLNRFDSVLEAGRRIFGPGTPTSQILQKMRQMGGDVYTDAGAEKMANRIETIAESAAGAGANVGAVLAGIGSGADRMKQFGFSSRMAHGVAMDAAERGVNAQLHNRVVGEFLAENSGFGMSEMNAETFAASYMQNRVQFAMRDSSKMARARMAATNAGYNGNDEVARIMTQEFTNETIEAFMSKDQLATRDSEFRRVANEEVATDRYAAVRRMAAASGNVNLRQLDKFFELRSMSGGKSAVEMSVNLHRARDKNASPEERAKAMQFLQGKLGGTSDEILDTAAFYDRVMADETHDVMKNVDISGLSEEDRKALREQKLANQPAAEALMDKLKLGQSKTSMERLWNTKGNAEGLRIKELKGEKATEGFDDSSREELGKAGIKREYYRNEIGDVATRYFEVTDTDPADDLTPQEAIRKANDVGVGDQAAAMIDNFMGKFKEAFADWSLPVVETSED